MRAIDRDTFVVATDKNIFVITIGVFWPDRRIGARGELFIMVSSFSDIKYNVFTVP